MLSAQQRAVLLLRDVVGMPAEETASALGISIVERRTFGFLPTGANGQPAFGSYVGGQLMAIHVLRIRGGRVIEMHHFMTPECFPVFGLPQIRAEKPRPVHPSG